MKAVLLAGGFGTRMRPLTLTRPKHLLPIANRAHIERVFDLLQRHGVNDVVLTTSYLAEAFEETASRAAERGLTLRVAHEETARGTGGAIKNAEPLLDDDDFLVLNADVLTGADLGALIAFHGRSGAAATLLLTPVEDPSQFGVVVTDGEGAVSAFIEKPPPGTAPTNLISAGVYVFSRDALDRIPSEGEHSAERALFPGLASAGALFATPGDGYWIDVGTPANYLRANRDVLGGALGRVDVVAIAESAWVASSAEVTGSAVGAGARIGERAVVTDSVLLPGARVGDGARVVDSILGEGASVAPSADVAGVVVADDEVASG